MKTTLVVIVVLAASSLAGRAQSAAYNYQLVPDIRQVEDEIYRLHQQMALDAKLARGEDPRVSYVDGVPQPPVLSNSIRTGTRRENQEKTDAYNAALEKYNARASEEQKRADQLTALQNQVARLTAQLKQVSGRVQQSTPQQPLSDDAYRAARQAVIQQAATDYPDLRDSNSRLWQTASQLAHAAQDPSNPDHQALQTVDGPRYFADKAARTIGLPVVARGAVSH